MDIPRDVAAQRGNRLMGRDRMRGILAARLAAALAAPAGAGETIRVNGSGAALDVMSVLITAYTKEHPAITFVMEKPLGSSGAIKALLAGALDLAVNSKKLTPEQAAQGAQYREYGVTPLVIVTEKKVPRTDVTTAELEGDLRRHADEVGARHAGAHRAAPRGRHRHHDPARALAG